MSTTFDPEDPEEWFLYSETGDHGPYGKKQLIAWLKDGLITPDRFAWKDGMADWIPITEVASPASLPIIPKSPSTSVVPKKTSRFDIRDFVVGGVFVAIAVYYLGFRSTLESEISPPLGQENGDSSGVMATVDTAPDLPNRELAEWVGRGRDLTLNLKFAHIESSRVAWESNRTEAAVIGASIWLHQTDIPYQIKVTPTGFQLNVDDNRDGDPLNDSSRAPSEQSGTSTIAAVWTGLDFGLPGQNYRLTLENRPAGRIVELIPEYVRAADFKLNGREYRLEILDRIPDGESTDPSDGAENPQIDNPQDVLARALDAAPRDIWAVWPTGRSAPKLKLGEPGVAELGKPIVADNLSFFLDAAWEDEDGIGLIVEQEPRKNSGLDWKSYKGLIIERHSRIKDVEIGEPGFLSYVILEPDIRVVILPSMKEDFERRDRTFPEIVGRLAIVRGIVEDDEDKGLCIWPIREHRDFIVQ